MSSEPCRAPSVRAKFKVVQRVESVEGWYVTLDPVTTGSVENASFYAATPSGYINLQVMSKDAASYFVVGEEVYVDFETVLAPATEA